MTLAEEKVSFDQRPDVVSELRNEIKGLKALLCRFIGADGAEPQDGWMNVSQLKNQYLELQHELYNGSAIQSIAGVGVVSNS